MAETISIMSIVRKNMVRDLAAEKIFCPRTGELLDYRTCVVLLNRSGHPAYVMSQNGWRQTPQPTRDYLAVRGVVVDEATVTS
jgi:hypothetical protein